MTSIHSLTSTIVGVAENIGSLSNRLDIVDAEKYVSDKLRDCISAYGAWTITVFLE